METKSPESIAHPGFAPVKADRVFFSAISWLMLVFVSLGFAHSYLLAGVFMAPLPSPVVHVHAAVLTCWMLLAVLQPTLVAAGRLDWHIRTGLFGMALALALPILSALTLAGAVRSHNLPPDFAGLIVSYDELIVLDFCILAAFGLGLRKRDSASHKRLMLLATASLMAPAVSRFPFALPIPALLAIVDIPIVALLAYDLIVRRKFFLASVLGGALLLASQALAFPLAGSTIPAALLSPLVH